MSEESSATTGRGPSSPADDETTKDTDTTSSGDGSTTVDDGSAETEGRGPS